MEIEPDATPPNPVPYKCGRTADPNVCLKFYFSPESGLYDLPPGGEIVDCTECEHFFE
jgi:hypothetical protein